MEIIRTEGLRKKFVVSQFEQEVLKGIDITINKSDFAGIVGPSGSGKTTLLYCLSSLEDITDGSVFLLGKDIAKYTEKEIAEIRRNDIGFVFQFYNLIPNLTVYENVMLAKVISKKEDSDIDHVLELVKMQDFKSYYPNQISGGMQQRVAIARALVNRPSVIFADEPTGNLDQRSGKEIMDLLKELNDKEKITVVLVTHNEDYLSYCNKTFKLVDGKIIL